MVEFILTSVMLVYVAKTEYYYIAICTMRLLALSVTIEILIGSEVSEPYI